jgi:hypothetical protein
MALSIQAGRAAFEALRSLAFGSVAAGYTAIGTPLLNPCRILTIVNTCDVGVILSLNGTTDHIIVPAGTAKVYDETANHVGNISGFFIPQGTQFYVKRAAGAPASGTVYIEVQYGLALQP